MPRPVTVSSVLLQRLTLVLLTSLFYWLIFPKANWSYLAWIAWIPLLLGIQALQRREAFLYGWLSGTVAYAGVLYWFLPTFKAAHLSIFFGLACLLGLSAYLGMYWGLWTALVNKTEDKIYYVPLAACGWVGLEFLKTHLLSGFPWMLAGESQWQQLLLIQIASLTGVYGLSFLLLFVNASLAALVRFLFFKDRRPAANHCVSATLVSLALLGGTLLYGHMHRAHLTRSSQGLPSLRVALLQPNIDQYKKWDDRYVAGILRTFERLAETAMVQKPDLMVWPEASVPGFALSDPKLFQWLSSLVKSTGVSHLVGSPLYQEQMKPPENPVRYKLGDVIYNSALLFDPQGQLMGGYQKMHLVPFGEYVPLQGTLGRFIRVLNDLGGFSAGQWNPVIPLGEIPLGVTICYEAIFPNLVRKTVTLGAMLLVNLTNDAWYMRTAAPYQHFIPNVFRAVENGRWVIRANNTGISGIVDPSGRVLAASPIYQEMVVSGIVQLREGFTVYTRYGDIFAWICSVVCLARILFLWKFNKRPA